MSKTWDDWPTFMISASNEQLQQQLEYTLIKPDCNSWWISKIQSGREDTLEERYAIKFCFKLFGLSVQVHSIGYSLRSCAKDMTITIVIINPRQEMRLECGWRHAQKRWAENLKDFEKDSVEVRPWCWDGTMQADNWVSVIGAENWVLCHWVVFYYCSGG